MIDPNDEFYDDLCPEDEFLAHYGRGHEDGGHSGRYPWGSGKNPQQGDENYKPPYDTPEEFLKDIDKKEKEEGLSQTAIAEMLGMENASELKAAKRAAGAYSHQAKYTQIQTMINEGKSKREIGRIMGMNESSIRSIADEGKNQRKGLIFDVAKEIKDAVDKHGIVDVGEGTYINLGIKEEALLESLYILRAEYGYKIQKRRIPIVNNPGRTITLKAAVPPDAPDDLLYKMDLSNPMHRIRDVGDVGDTGEARNIKPAFQKPVSIARNRVFVRYRDDVGPDGHTGIERDGFIEIRPGVKDLSLSGALYSQVRIAVDDEHGNPSYYLKGMAAYTDRIPEGYDIVVNTNRRRGQPDKEVFKELKKLPHSDVVDWENPFGALIKDDGQYYYKDDDGSVKLGAINKRADEGDWQAWSKSLPAQFLAKQNPKLVRQQLNMTIAEKRQELEEISSITNPTLKKKMLEDFAGQVDSQSVHLKAAALPHQKYHVLLPAPTLKDNECFAPNYPDGTELALVRFPHEGIFQIPKVIVNNKNKEALMIMQGNKHPQDVIFVNPNTSEQLSGADFDGDTVIAIPQSDTVNVSSRKPLEGLIGFDTKEAYPPQYKRDPVTNEKILDADGKPIILSKVMSKKDLQQKMGQASNLITDMNLMGATDEEMTRAVKYSMTVVDSPKHKLDHMRAYSENRIKELKDKYQKHNWVDWEGNIHYDSTSSATLISRAKAQYSEPVSKGYLKTDPETGKQYMSREGEYKTVIDWKHTPYTLDPEIMVKDKKTGKMVPKKNYDMSRAVEKVQTRKSNWMSVTEDAHDLVRDPNNEIEVMYADFANSLKAIANEARKEALFTKGTKYSVEAAKQYEEEVKSLNEKLQLVKANAPREREANLLANLMLDEWLDAQVQQGNEIENAERKKRSDALLKKARLITGASRPDFDFTDAEWEAIQAGAISDSKAKELFMKVNQDKLKARALPKEQQEITPAKEKLLLTMATNGYTNAEISERIGISETEVNKFLRERR